MSKVKVISFGKDKKSAEIVILDNNKSFTKHLKLKLVKYKDKNDNECKKYQWFYLNPSKKEVAFEHNAPTVPPPPSPCKNTDKKDSNKNSDDNNSKDS